MRYVLLLLLILLSPHISAQRNGAIGKKNNNYLFRPYENKLGLVTCFPLRNSAWDDLVGRSFVNYYFGSSKSKEAYSGDSIARKLLSSIYSFYCVEPGNSVKIYRVQGRLLEKMMPITGLQDVNITLYFLISSSYPNHFIYNTYNPDFSFFCNTFFCV